MFHLSFCLVVPKMFSADRSAESKKKEEIIKNRPNKTGKKYMFTKTRYNIQIKSDFKKKEIRLTLPRTNKIRNI